MGGGAVPVGRGKGWYCWILPVDVDTATSTQPGRCVTPHPPGGPIAPPPPPQLPFTTPHAAPLTPTPLSPHLPHLTPRPHPLTHCSYVRTMANPAAALVAQQQQSVAALQRGRAMGPGGAPLPMGRSTGTVVLLPAAAAPAGVKAAGGAAGPRAAAAAAPAGGPRAAAAAAAGPRAAAAAGGPAKRKSPPSSSGAGGGGSSDSGGGGVLLLEDDDMFGAADEARSRAVELVRQAGGCRCRREAAGGASLLGVIGWGGRGWGWGSCQRRAVGLVRQAGGCQC